MNDPTTTELSRVGVVLTGGLGAIGREITELLSARGARVVINDLPDPDGIDAAPGIGYVSGDAAEPGAADRILDEAVAALGELPQAVCLHAGIVRSGSVLDATLDDLEVVWRTNVASAFTLAQAAARRWVAAQTPGCLVFTSSWVQDVAWPGIAAYSSSKAALASLARSFARELAPYGIRANVVAPGIVGSGMALRQWEEEPDYRARASRAIPLGQLQPPRTVAEAIAFLVSDRSAYMTGTTLLIDGGASLYPLDPDEQRRAGRDRARGEGDA